MTTAKPAISRYPLPELKDLPDDVRERLADRTGWEWWALRDAMAPYWAEHDVIHTDADARSAAMFSLREEPDRWVITQQLADPAGGGEWRFTAVVDLALAEEEGAPTLRLETLAPA